MTSLELTNWRGVDSDGPFLVMFGHVDQTPDPDEMAFSKLSPGGLTKAAGTCVYESDSSFTIKDTALGYLVPMVTTGVFSFSVSGEILTITVGGTTWKAALV
jgi:hypothetical protein